MNKVVIKKLGRRINEFSFKYHNIPAYSYNEEAFVSSFFADSGPKVIKDRRTPIFSASLYENHFGDSRLKSTINMKT